MTKADIVLATNQTPEVVNENEPLVLTQVCPHLYSVETGVVELKVLKSHRRMVVKVKEISLGVTVKIVILRNGVFLEEINLTNDSDLKVTFDLKKNDQLFFAYTNPLLLPPIPDQKINLKLSIKKKYQC